MIREARDDWARPEGRGSRIKYLSCGEIEDETLFLFPACERHRMRLVTSCQQTSLRIQDDDTHRIRTENPIPVQKSRFSHLTVWKKYLLDLREVGAVRESRTGAHKGQGKHQKKEVNPFHREYVSEIWHFVTKMHYPELSCGQLSLKAALPFRGLGQVARWKYSYYVTLITGFEVKRRDEDDGRALRRIRPTHSPTTRRLSYIRFCMTLRHRAMGRLTSRRNE